tara:strand:+ start:571 stop:759 length:189 start_codon:yes stop_codon:yes gene_type:complete
MKVAIIGSKKNTKSLAMEIAIKCNIPIVVAAKRTLCLDCEKNPAVAGYDLHFCEECWENAVD